MHKITIEICCGSAEDVSESKKNGADRVELNSCLFLGGLTPSLGELTIARKTDIEIITMTRPRGGGFCYTKTEYENALLDAKYFLNNGADGIAFGFLNKDGSIDEERCKRMLDVIGDHQSVFHRAFDVVPNWKTSMDTLCKLGVSRVLTSGQHATALDGAEAIKEMIDYSAGRIQILPGSGINANNAESLIKTTGCTQIHAGLRKTSHDCSSNCNPAIHFIESVHPSEDQYSMTNGGKVRDLRKATNSIHTGE
ncbi:MAG: copper homeostasis protein CutC [Sporolactobacillus sp.]